MAVLNYGKYSEVSKYIGISKPSAVNGVNVGDWAKIFFTPEGDIITHGKNYTDAFKGALKGLVPDATGVDRSEGKRFNFLNDRGNWVELSVAELPIAKDHNVNSEDYIFNAKQIHEHFKHQLSAVDAMRFKGGFDASNIAGFPAGNICEAGDTYRVTQPGEYAGEKLTPGDLLICIQDNTDTNKDLNSADYWIVIEQNIGGTTTHVINGAGFTVYSDRNIGEEAFNIYAPTTAGTQDQVLVSTAGTPTWKDVSALNVLNQSVKSEIAGSLTIGPSGTFTLNAIDSQNKVLSSYTTSIATDTWNININGVANGGTKGKLSLGDGLKFSNPDHTNFGGTDDRTIVLKAATKTSLGGVIIDSLGAYTGKGKEGDTISITEAGNIYLTKDNIANALGFMPGNTNNVYQYSHVITNDAETSSDATGTINNPFFNLTSLKEGSSVPEVVSSTQFIGTNGIKIDGQTGKIQIDLQAAKTDTLGGIKVAKINTEAIAAEVSGESILPSRYYGVEIDNAGKAFVYVPWEDKKPAFSKILVNNSADSAIEAASVASTFAISAGNGINLTLSSPNNIIINSDIYQVVSQSQMGYAPAMNSVGESAIDNAYYVLSYKGSVGAPTWNKLPATAFSDTWRSILVNGSNFLGNEVGKAVNFTATGAGNKTVITPNADEGIINISSSWRDLYVNDVKVGVDSAFGINPSEDIAIHQGITEVDGKTVETIAFELVWWNLDAQEVEKASDSIPAQ